MYFIERQASFEYAHRLLDHPAKCKCLHGHSGKAIVRAYSDTLDNQGMVMDFSVLKQQMNQLLDEWDHATLLQKNDPLIPVLQTLGQRVIIFVDPPTAENMCRYMFIHLTAQGMKVDSVTIYETENNCATVRF